MPDDLKTLTDNQLLKHLADAPEDKNLFYEFYNRFHGLICFVIKSCLNTYKVKDRAINANDLISDFYVKLFDPNKPEIHKFRGEREKSAASWLSVIARNLVINQAIRKYPFISFNPGISEHLRGLFAPNSIADTLNREELERLIAICLNKVAEQYKDVHLHKFIFRLWLDNFNAATICDGLSGGLTVKTVRNKIADIKQHVRLCIEKRQS